MKKAAIYARMAVTRRAEEAIDRQSAALMQGGSARGYEGAADGVCADDGYSGATLARPGLDRLRNLAAAGSIEAMLVSSPDRLSRSCAGWLLLLEELSRSGVEVVFLSDPPATAAQEHPVPAEPIA